MKNLNVTKRGNVYQYRFEIEKVNGSSTKEALRNYQKVIKSSLRDATYYIGFIKYDPAADLQIPRVLSFELKKTM